MAAKKSFHPEDTRIFGVAAHIDAGKTTVSERMLFVSGVQYRPGLVDEGTTVMDHEAEERERGITIHSAAIELPWHGTQFTLIDTPGHVDFTAEVERCMRILDGCVLVLDASAGVEAQSETVWRQAEAHGVVRIAFLNKLDKVGVDWEGSLQSIRDRLGAEPVPLQLPLLDGEAIRLVDLIGRRVFSYEGKTASAACLEQEWPTECREAWEQARVALIEQVATFDEELLDRYVEDDVSDALLVAAIRRQTLAGAILPVLGGAALRGIGVEPLMDAVAAYLPSPLDRASTVDELAPFELDPSLPLAAQIFKVVATRHGAVSWVRIYQGCLAPNDQVRVTRTGKVQRVHGLFKLAGGDTESIEAGLAGDVFALKGLKDVVTGDVLAAPKHAAELPSWTFPLPVIAMAVEARKVEDRDRLMATLASLEIEDPTMDWRTDDETGQLLVSGMGELHLQILANKLQRDFKLDVQLGKPRVAYRESLGGSIRLRETVTRHLPTKEVRVFLDVSFEPASEVDAPRVTDAMPASMLDSAAGRLIRAEAVGSLRSDLTAGLAHGFPATQVVATIHAIGDDENPSPSLEDVEAALSMLVRQLGKRGDVRILEPWMVVDVRVPEEHMSPVLGDIQAHGGEVQNVTVQGGAAHLEARAPLSKLLEFTTRLRSLTAGRGGASMHLDRYREVSRQDLQRLLGLT